MSRRNAGSSLNHCPLTSGVSRPLKKMHDTDTLARSLTAEVLVVPVPGKRPRVVLLMNEGGRRERGGCAVQFAWVDHCP